jgi:hypothetical protein
LSYVIVQFSEPREVFIGNGQPVDHPPAPEGAAAMPPVMNVVP